MRFNYTLYPEAKQKFDESGVTERVKQALKNHKISIHGATFESDVRQSLEEMIEDTFSSPLIDEFFTNISNSLENISNLFYTIKRPVGDLREQVYLEDILGVMGWWNHNLFGTDEVFYYDKFGFESLSDFTGSFTALVYSQTRNISTYRRGYTWKTEKNGRILESEITGDSNGDLRISRINITPYETFDFLGNNISYRPEFSVDREGISPYHSTEMPLLAGILKWVEQCKIETESSKDNFKGVIEWAESLDKLKGSTNVDRFYSRQCFVADNVPIPLFDPSNSKVWSSRNLGTVGSYTYGLYLGSNSELLLVTQPDRDQKLRGIAATFYPDEADHLIKGLLYQCANLLGRTSLVQLKDLIEYRFSQQYKDDQQRFK